MATLDDLPPYRRAKLLWLWAHLGVERVETLVREAEGQPCDMPTGPAVPPGPTAVLLGDDGRYHLLRGGHLLCAAAQTADGWPHQGYCSWIDRGTGPEDVSGRGTVLEEDAWISLHHVWNVRTVGPEHASAEVDPSQRCDGGDYTVAASWPPPPTRTRSIRLLREALVAALGPDCQVCGLYPGAMVDHDHETGYVRGLLCRFCNRTLEECPHVTDCSNADYMSNPPAAALALLYPAHEEWRSKESTRQRKIMMLGFDPFEGLPPRRPRNDSHP
ncbi:endonuclease domain-containing protein (plasmid) [Streptomyces sp. JL4002]|uniref:endonuclease domain-containing protein n=1 Tax=Streptomyces sp. JL4002 TaxID=3404781 RepID=UPI003B281507